METGCLLHCLEVEETNVFEAVKQSVTTRQAALVYGISVGRNGMACCPFHDDRHPSMKVDRRFHCFACQADGDVIDFTSRLFGLSSKEAALKLAEDFSISFDRKGHDPPQKRVIKRKISEEMRYRQAEQKCFRVLCDYLRLKRNWMVSRVVRTIMFIQLRVVTNTSHQVVQLVSSLNCGWVLLEYHCYESK